MEPGYPTMEAINKVYVLKAQGGNYLVLGIIIRFNEYVEKHKSSQVVFWSFTHQKRMSYPVVNYDEDFYIDGNGDLKGIFCE